MKVYIVEKIEHTEWGSYSCGFTVFATMELAEKYSEEVLKEIDKFPFDSTMVYSKVVFTK